MPGSRSHECLFKGSPSLKHDGSPREQRIIKNGWYSERGTTSNYSSYFLQSKKERLKHECPICFRKVLARSLNRHMATLHCKQAFPCEYCDRAFTRKDTRAWHTTEKHSKIRRSVSKKRTSYGNAGLLEPFARAPRECD